MTIEEALRAVAAMYNTCSTERIEPLLAQEFHYASQWVFSEHESKNEFLDYMREKLKTVAASGEPVFAELATTGPQYGSQPCLVLAQGGRERLVATILVEVSDGMISRVDVCAVPPPEATTRSGMYPR